MAHQDPPWSSYRYSNVGRHSGLTELTIRGYRRTAEQAGT